MIGNINTKMIDMYFKYSETYAVNKRTFKIDFTSISLQRLINVVYIEYSIYTLD